MGDFGREQGSLRTGEELLARRASRLEPSWCALTRSWALACIWRDGLDWHEGAQIGELVAFATSTLLSCSLSWTSWSVEQVLMTVVCVEVCVLLP